MHVRIHPIRLGFGWSYVIQGDGSVLIDAGSPSQVRAFEKALARLLIPPDEIQLMLITHGHWDHIGSAKEIKEMTGARIAMHQREKDWLEQSLKIFPPGVTAWGRTFVRILTWASPLIDIPAAKVDIVLGDEGLSLAEYGIPGRVIYTPGHSLGSVTVVLDTGDALVGDLAMNELPLRFSPGLPVLAEDLDAVKRSWQRLLDEGAQRVYPGHGKPFSAEIMRRAVA